LLAYPTAAVTWFLVKPEGFESIFIAIILAVISQTRQFIKHRHVNFLFRMDAGVALGFGFGGLLWALKTHNTSVIMLIIISGVTYALIKYYSMKEIFKKNLEK
jgi:uncharacterized membrane protein YgaE (UPF0421/DUF939 family)